MYENAKEARAKEKRRVIRIVDMGEPASDGEKREAELTLKRNQKPEGDWPKNKLKPGEKREEMSQEERDAPGEDLAADMRKAAGNGLEEFEELLRCEERERERIGHLPPRPVADKKGNRRTQRRARRRRATHGIPDLAIEAAIEEQREIEEGKDLSEQEEKIREQRKHRKRDDSRDRGSIPIAIRKKPKEEEAKPIKKTKAPEVRIQGGICGTSDRMHTKEVDDRWVAAGQWAETKLEEWENELRQQIKDHKNFVKNGGQKLDHAKHDEWMKEWRKGKRNRAKENKEKSAAKQREEDDTNKEQTNEQQNKEKRRNDNKNALADKTGTQ